MGSLGIAFAAEAGLKAEEATSITLVSEVKIVPAFPVPLNAKAHHLGTNFYFLESVRAACDWGHADFVIEPGELWAARSVSTNITYQGKTVGHMVSTRGHDEKGVLVRADAACREDIPDRLRLVDQDVVIKSEQMDAVMGEVAKGNAGWCLALTLHFNRFDYVLVAPNGEREVVLRQHDTAHLTRNLSAFGGCGSYQGRRLLRLIRFPTFGPKNLFKNESLVKAHIQQTLNNTTKLQAEVKDLLAKVKRIETTPPQSPAHAPVLADTTSAVANAVSAAFDDDLGTAEVNLLKSQAQKDVASHFAGGWR